MADITISPGDHPTAAQFNSNMLHTGGAWNSWTPTVTQSGSVALTVGGATYFRASRLITFRAELTISGTGTANTDIVITTPVAAAGIGSTTILGRGGLYDVSAATRWYGDLIMISSTTMKIVDPLKGALIYLGGSTSTLAAALAAGDVISLMGSYEAAAG
jgi:hypothetical protein